MTAMDCSVRDVQEEGEFDGTAMPSTNRRRVALYVDRAASQWVVRDPDGMLWLLPPREDPWEHRQPYLLAEEADLEVVPGHYRHMLNLPF